ncbi:MAG: hypothetical protein HS116_18330 [Planctomycetes bacterium]|nr:hypothetical protein [Planctomycetota bacterium]
MARKSRQHDAVEQSIRTIKRAIFVAPELAEVAQVLTPHPTQAQVEEAVKIILNDLVKELKTDERMMTLLALITVSEKPNSRLEISRTFEHGASLRLIFENLKTLKPQRKAEFPCHRS